MGGRIQPDYPATLNRNRWQVCSGFSITVKDKNLEGVDVLYLVLENKIKKSAINDLQIKKQFEFISSSDDFSKEIPIYNVLITPDETVFQKMYEVGKGVNKNTIWLKWYSTENNHTIVGIIQKLVELEHNAMIQPIDTNTQYILKSFIDYLSTEFAEKMNGKKNFDIRGFQVIDEFIYNFKNEIMTIRRYSNQMIRLFDKNDELINIDVKPILREIINLEKLNIILFHSTGTNKNTQILGKEVIQKLKAKSST